MSASPTARGAGAGQVLVGAFHPIFARPVAFLSLFVVVVVLSVLAYTIGQFGAPLRSANPLVLLGAVSVAGLLSAGLISRFAWLSGHGEPVKLMPIVRHVAVRVPLLLVVTVSVLVVSYIGMLAIVIPGVLILIVAVPALSLVVNGEKSGRSLTARCWEVGFLNNAVAFVLLVLAWFIAGAVLPTMRHGNLTTLGFNTAVIITIFALASTSPHVVWSLAKRRGPSAEDLGEVFE